MRICFQLHKIFVRYCFIIMTILLCCNAIAQAKGIEPSFEIDLDLKKDEVVLASISASKDSQSSADKDFTLRWTLYRNEGLVVLLRYDKYPYQFVLYSKEYKLNGYKLNLLDTQGVNSSVNQPYIIIYFLGIDNPFNDEKSVAHLRVRGFGEASFMRKN